MMWIWIDYNKWSSSWLLALLCSTRIIDPPLIRAFYGSCGHNCFTSKRRSYNNGSRSHTQNRIWISEMIRVHIILLHFSCSTGQRLENSSCEICGLVVFFHVPLSLASVYGLTTFLLIHSHMQSIWTPTYEHMGSEGLVLYNIFWLFCI